jgi:hypothetical protein
MRHDDTAATARKRWRGALALALLAASTPAAAETLYKCVDAAGLTTIQQAPCAKGTTQVWARDSAPEPPPSPEQLAAAQARADAQARERAEAQARREAEAARPPPLTPEQQAEAAAIAAERVADEANAATRPPVAQAPDSCEKAQEFAAQLRAKPWIELDANEQQRLYGWLMQECATAR